MEIVNDNVRELATIIRKNAAYFGYTVAVEYVREVGYPELMAKMSPAEIESAIAIGREEMPRLYVHEWRSGGGYAAQCHECKMVLDQSIGEDCRAWVREILENADWRRVTGREGACAHLAAAIERRGK